MEYFRDIEKFIGDGNSKTFKRIYRATRDGCSPEMFHVCCDGKGPTLTVFHSLNNTIYGGYTRASWSSQSSVFKSDQSAFLFYKLDHCNERCVKIPINPKKAQYAIKCEKTCGPIFGHHSPLNPIKRHDLLSFTEDISLTKRGSLLYHFELNGYVHINGCYGLSETRSGQLTGGSMNVTEIEVFQVIDDVCSKNWKKKPPNAGSLKERLAQLEPLPQLDVYQFNILLVGIIGSGKSSFYNTVASAMKSEIVHPAASGEADYSITNKLIAYTVAPGNHDGHNLKLMIFDSRGLEQGRGFEHEAEYLLEGLLPVGYQFPEIASPVDKKSVEHRSRLNGEMHLVCFVVDATKVDVVKEHEALLEKINGLLKAVRRKGVPVVAVLAKIDELCPKVKEDIGTLYKSPRIEAANDKAASLLGLSPSDVYPISNYTIEHQNNPKKDALALHALLSMANCIRTYLETKIVAKPRIDPWTSRGGQTGEEKEFLKEKIVRRLEQEFTQGACPVLLIGETSSGKSSYVNSMYSALTGHISNKAETGTSPVSITLKFEAFPLKYKDPEDNLRPIPVKLCDMPGLEEENGVTMNTINFILKGNVPSGYKVKDGINPRSKHFRKKPEKQKKIHCVCFVYDISKTDIPVRTTAQIIRMLKDLDIPYMFLTTKIDQLCSDVNADICQVFKSTKVKKKIAKIAKDLDKRLPMFFPVRNYEHETVCDNDMDILLLRSFENILELCQEYNEKERLDSDDESDEE